MTKTAIVFPEEPDSHANLLDDYGFETPLGPALLDSVLLEKGYNSKFFIPFDGLEQMINDIIEFHPDYLLLSVMTHQALVSLEIASFVKTHLPDITVIAGGYHPTLVPEFVKNKFVDYVIVREAVETLPLLLNALDMKESFDSVRGVRFVKDNEILYTGDPLRPSLKNLPFATRNKRVTEFSGHPSIFFNHYGKPTRYESILFSMGCSRACSFCASPKLMPGGVVYRDPKDVRLEIEYLIDNFGIDMVGFEDVSFGDSPAHLSLLLAELGKVKGVTYWVESNVKSIINNSEMYGQMRNIGFNSVAVGVESLNNSTLAGMGKKQTLDDVQIALNCLDSLDYLVHGFLMVGFDNESEDDIMQLKHSLSCLPIHQLRLSIATPFPGTPWYERLESENMIPQTPDWSLFDTNNLVYDHPFISPDRMKGLQLELYKTFYLSKEWNERITSRIKSYPNQRTGLNEFRDYTVELVKNL